MKIPFLRRSDYCCCSREKVEALTRLNRMHSGEEAKRAEGEAMFTTVRQNEFATFAPGESKDTFGLLTVLARMVSFMSTTTPTMFLAHRMARYRHRLSEAYRLSGCQALPASGVSV